MQSYRELGGLINVMLELSYGGLKEEDAGIDGVSMIPQGNPGAGLDVKHHGVYRLLGDLDRELVYLHQRYQTLLERAVEKGR